MVGTRRTKYIHKEANMKRLATIRIGLLVVLSILSIGYWSVAAQAFPIKYTFSGTAAFGDINGVAFDDVSFKISISGDTIHVDATTDPTTPLISNLSGTITISGPGINVVGRFTDPITVFVNHTNQAVGFGNALLGDLIDLYVPGAGLNTYNLSSLFGPVTAGESAAGSTLFFSQFGGVTLDIGLLTFDDIGDVTFAAVPKPPLLVDFDGDSKSDISLWRPGDGFWYIKQSSNGAVTQTQWGIGALNDVIVPGDYDGDGKTDIAVWRPGDGVWYIKRSSDGTVVQTQWGLGALGDVPVPGDYDGDGKTDIAIWRPGDGFWYIINSSTGLLAFTQWGTGVLSDVPVPGDYDGDGKTDIAVWRPGDGFWYIINSSTGLPTFTQWGTGVLSDVPVPGDYDGDGKTDIAFWRPGDGFWYIHRSLDGAVTQTPWGILNDVPIPGDYDGDGKTDIAVWRPGDGFWYILGSLGVVTQTQWGIVNDIPLSR